MKQYIGLGVALTLIFLTVVALMPSFNAQSQPTQADSDGLPRGVEFYRHNGHDCYVYDGYNAGGVTCINPESRHPLSQGGVQLEAPE